MNGLDAAPCSYSDHARWLTVTFFLITACIAPAWTVTAPAATAPSTIDKDLCKQFDNLKDPEDIKRQLVAYMEKCQPEMYRMFLMMSQAALGRLGYGVGPFTGILDEKTRKAFGAYQKNSGLPVTGDYTNETMERLQKDEASLDALPIHLPMYTFGDSQWDQFVSVTGTWVMENETTGIPLQSTTIECSRPSMRCIEAMAQVSPGDWRTLESSIELHDVERWDEHEIVTKPNDFLCTRYTMRISREQKTVTGLRATIGKADICKDVVESRDLRLHLADGFKVWQQLSDEQLKVSRKLIQADWTLVDKAMERKKRENDEKSRNANH